MLAVLQFVENSYRYIEGRGKPSQTPKFFPSPRTPRPIPWLAAF